MGLRLLQPQSWIRHIAASVIVSTSLAIGGCVFMKPQPKLTPLELQALQSRQYTESFDIIFASIISVFQDLGYSIQSADKDSGLISAESPAQRESAGFWNATGFWGWGDLSEGHRTVSTRATAFLETIGTQTNVRLNFVYRATRYSGHSGSQGTHESPIYDANAYRNAFDRIENAIFIRQSSQ